ncbi:hypothetical protein [Thiothrix nivea]|uniref:Nucleoside 2-deoxyribosyltransferase n=1 Tax=Thiothrix nivea (strain ATCC 35100 / DSM 5205 / JP2) TaxID=870187 RepID=A0A656HLI8_THINJ|nr:hypothetical protein [Thiothrix nivea]EIJ36984.1 hypothetical protein Thini_4510 [Thiothrix nivea DSM 5205]
MLTICGSLSFFEEIRELKKKLTTLGISSEIPDNYDEGNDKVDGEVMIESILYNRFINSHLEKISNTNGILIANYKKNGIDGYVGPNTLVEAAFAYALNKKIFILNNLGKQGSRDVLLGMLPTLLKGDINAIKNHRT